MMNDDVNRQKEKRISIATRMAGTVVLSYVSSSKYRLAGYSHPHVSARLLRSTLAMISTALLQIFGK